MPTLTETAAAAVARFINDSIVTAVRYRRPFKTAHLYGRPTAGGTYLLGVPAPWNDDDKPRDLLAILPADLGNGRVVVLRPTANPDVVAYLERELARHEGHSDGCSVCRT